jgi:hypothetical protein
MTGFLDIRKSPMPQRSAIDNDTSIIGRPWAVIIDPAVGLSEEAALTAVRLLGQG